MYERTPSEVSEYDKEDIRDIIQGTVKSSDIADNLTTDDATKVLSAKQGKVLKNNADTLGNTVSDLKVQVYGKDYLDEEHSTFLTSNGITSAAMMRNFVKSFKMLATREEGDDYGATGNPITTLANFYRERTIYLSFFGASGFSKLRIAAPNLFLDRYYGYPFSLRRISNRFNGTSVTDGTTTVELLAKEVYHDNWLHPTDGGYAQIGDGLFGAYVGVLTE